MARGTSEPSWTGTQSSCHRSLWLHPQAPFPAPSCRCVTGRGRGEAPGPRGAVGEHVLCLSYVREPGGGKGIELREGLVSETRDLKPSGGPTRRLAEGRAVQALGPGAGEAEGSGQVGTEEGRSPRPAELGERAPSVPHTRSAPPAGQWGRNELTAQSRARPPAAQTTGRDGTTPWPRGPKTGLVAYGGNVGGSLPVTQTGKQRQLHGHGTGWAGAVGG